MRKETQRLLAGRNQANPVEFNSAFNLRAPREQVVPGVQGVNVRTADISSSALSVMDNIAQWGNKKIAEAAERKYSRLLAEGAMEQAQGKAIEEIAPGDQQWRLEGYRVMDAETASAALLAAQQQEIDQGLFELDPAEFRQRSANRLSGLLEGKDVRTQELIRDSMLKQMPDLVARHTARRTQFLEQKAYDSLSTAVQHVDAVTGTDNLLKFARGEAGADGLSSERRRSAVLQGVVNAFANDNPTAWALLEQSGVLGEMKAEELGVIRSAQEGYESRARSRYDEATFAQEQEILGKIRRGEYTDPLDAVREYSNFMTSRGLTLRASEAGEVYSGAFTGAGIAQQATKYDIEAARIKGDYGKVAKLSQQYLSSTGSIPAQVKAGIFSGESGGDYDALFNFSNRGGEFGNVKLTSMTVDQAIEFSDPHGAYGQWVKGKIGKVSTPMGAYQIVGTTLRDAKKAMGLTGNEVMSPGMQDKIGGWIYQTQGTGAWEGYKGPAMGGNGAEPDVLDISPARWEALVAKHAGNFDVAIVEATNGEAFALKWAEQGMDESKLSASTRARINMFESGLQGEQYSTAQTRLATAKEAYEFTAQRAAVDVYARLQGSLRKLDSEFASTNMTEEDYLTKRTDMMRMWGQEVTKQDIAAAFAQADAKAKALQKGTEDLAKEQQNAINEDYRIQEFNARQDRDAKIKAATEAPMPEGMNEQEFLAAQKQQINAATQEYIDTVTTAAQETGVSVTVSEPSRINEETSKSVVQGIVDAEKNAQEGAQIGRAVRDGTLDNLPDTLRDRAYREAQGRFVAEANADIAAGRATPDEAQTALENKMTNWFSKAGHVPAEIKARHSAVLNGNLVKSDGTVNPGAVSAVQSYNAMLQKDPVTASKLMDDGARMVADAAIELAGGNMNLLPDVLADLWAEGLSGKFGGKPDPQFLERPDVQDAIADATSVGIFKFGETEVVRNLNKSPEAMAQFKSELNERIMLAYRMNPRVNPKHLVNGIIKQMSDNVQMVGNTMVSDPSGGNVQQQMFGSEAGAYAGDPRVMETALMNYMTSPEFTADYGAELPAARFGVLGTVGLGLTAAFGGPAAVQARVSDEALRRKQFTDNTFVTALGNGQVLVEVQLDSTGRIGEFIIPLSTIGDHFKKNDPKFK